MFTHTSGFHKTLDGRKPNGIRTEGQSVFPNLFFIHKSSWEANPSLVRPMASESDLSSTARSADITIKKCRLPLLSRKNRFLVLAPSMAGRCRRPGLLDP